MLPGWAALGGGSAPANHSQADHRPNTRQPIRIQTVQALFEWLANLVGLIGWCAPTYQCCPSSRHVPKANIFEIEMNIL